MEWVAVYWKLGSFYYHVRSFIPCVQHSVWSFGVGKRTVMASQPRSLGREKNLKNDNAVQSISI